MLQRVICVATAAVASGGMVGMATRSMGFLLMGAAFGALAASGLVAFGSYCRAVRPWTFRVLGAHLELPDGRTDAVTLRLNPDGSFEGLDGRLELTPGATLRVDTRRPRIAS
jgi:hypothetical protein